MPETFQAEFTGERVIPGRVEENLFNEHLARYRFTAKLVRDLALTGHFLDAGCGAGYGAAALAETGSRVLGIDVADEAVTHARANYGNAGVDFEQASCMQVPAEDGAFRLITAFEVIEHIPDWRDFLREARRVLEPAGLLLVSTPNQLYYAESREKAGPNPFHVHEFTAEEFRAELTQVFPHVKLLLQNHVAGIAFSGAEAEGAAVEITEHRDDPDAAHFFLAICSGQPLPPVARFVFIPDAGNVLQTRERHIALLDGEIATKNRWIETEKVERARMMEKVVALEGELEEHNRWARAANQEAERRAQLVAELQAELRKSNDWAKVRDAEAVERGRRIEHLQEEVRQTGEELRKSNEWAQARDAEAKERANRIVELQEEARKLSDDIKRSNDWAQEMNAAAEERGRRVVELQEEVWKASTWAQTANAEAEERGRRVIELQDEVWKMTAWAQSANAEAEERGQRVVELQDEVWKMTAWAQSASAEAEERGRRVVELQEELAREQANNVATQQAMAAEQARLHESMQAEYERLQQEMAATSAGYESAIAQWQRDKEASDRWAMETERLSGERDAAREAYAAKETELETAYAHNAALDVELGTAYAHNSALEAEADDLKRRVAEMEQQLAMIAQSRWVKLGRVVRVGPEIHAN